MFTKGKWQAELRKPDNCYRIYSASPTYIKQAEIADVFGTLDEDLANARLIVAAPAMYEAIRNFIKATESANNPRFSVRMGKAFCGFRNALALADGKGEGI